MLMIIIFIWWILPYTKIDKKDCQYLIDNDFQYHYQFETEIHIKEMWQEGKSLERGKWREHALHDLFRFI